MKKIVWLIALCCMAGSVAQAAVQGKELSYQADDATLKGYIAYDEGSWRQATVFLREELETK